MHSDIDDLIDARTWIPLPSPESPALRAGTAAFSTCPAVVVASRYEHGAGTFGAREVALLVEAVSRATRARLPLISLVQSGGVRLTEGVLPFVGLRDVARALGAHRQRGLVHVVHLQDPAMGGVLATWGATADIITASPGGRVALTGPGAGVSAITAERLLGDGLIDAVLGISELRGRLCTLLEVLNKRGHSGSVVEPRGPDLANAPSGWAAVVAARRTERLGVDGLVNDGLRHGVTLAGDRSGNNDPNVLTVIGTFAGRSCLLIACAVRSPVDRTGPTASGLRKARRAMKLADQVGLPVVCLADVASPGEDESDMAYEVGRCVDTLTGLRVPSVGVLVGEGGGGVALALLATKTVLALRDSWLAPLVPERAAAVLHLPGGAPEYADAIAIGARELAGLGVVDEVVQPTSSLVLERVAYYLDRQWRTSESMELGATPSTVR